MAALRFFRRTIGHHGEPEVVTSDNSAANSAILTTLNADKPDKETITVRPSQYPNHLISQGHWNIKQLIHLMRGVKSFRQAQTILASIELIHIKRKGQLYHPAGD